MVRAALSRPHNRFFVMGLLVLAFAVRGGVLLARRGDLAADPDGYRQLAANLVEQGEYGYWVRDESTGESSIRATAFRPPLYPLVLACVAASNEANQALIAILHLMLGIATVAMVYALSLRWELGRWALVAAALTACDPILLNQSTLLMTETLATFLAVLGLVCLTRLSEKSTFASAALAGGTLAIASLCRPTFLAWLAMVAVLLILSWCLRTVRPAIHKRSEAGTVPVRRGFRPARAALESRHTKIPVSASRLIVFVLVAAGVLSPWVFRNDVALGRPIVATTHGGYTLLLANNDGFYDFLRQSHWGDVWDSRELDEQYNRIKQQLDYDEVKADRWARDQAMACIGQRGGMFAFSCAVRMGRLWGLVPHQIDRSESMAGRLARYTVGLWYGLVFLFSAIGVFFLGKRLFRAPWIWGLLLCLSFTAVHTVYWSNLRMRAPLMPVVLMAAAFGAERIAAGHAAERT